MRQNKAGEDRTSTLAKASSTPYHVSNLNRDAPDYILYLQRTIGNKAVQGLMRSSVGLDFSKIGIQPKLKVNQPGDEYEQEADRIAEKVMRMPFSDSAMPMTISMEEGIDRKCSTCGMEREDEKKIIDIGRRPSSTFNLEASEEFTNEINNIRSSNGSLLDSSTKEFMNSRFGHDFSSVRVHTDESAARSANSANARAYTIGNDVVFGKGQYQPNTLEGRRLLAHELTHVVQQNTMTSAMSIQRDVGWTRRGPLPDPYGELFLLNAFAKKYLDAAKLIHQNPVAMKLVNEAEAAGIQFGGYAEDGPSKTLGRAYTSGTTVYVPKTQTDPVMAMRDFLFELNNALRAPKFAELTKEATKGSKGTLSASQYAYKMVEQEVEGMLRLGEIWFETRKTAPKDPKTDVYNAPFFLPDYEAVKNGKKTKDDLVKEVLKRVYDTGTLKGKTVEQYYTEYYEKFSGGK